jgi:hypothetical protein
VKGVTPDAVLNLSEAVWRAYGAAGLQPARAALSPQLLAQRPRFAAEVALAEGNSLLAQRHLAAAVLERLPPADRPAWAKRLGPGVPEPVVFGTLSGLWQHYRLPRELVQIYVELARLRGLALEPRLAAHTPGQGR